MKRVVQVKLLPLPEQAQTLGRTLLACNEAANAVSRVALERGVFRNYDLRKIAYAELRAQGFGSQVAQHVIEKVTDAYTTLRANCRNGRLGRAGSARRVRVETTPIGFRTDAAQPFDDRCLSWDHNRHTVSIWTVDGRVKDVPFTGSATDLRALAVFRKGETDLICRDGIWLLIATLDEPASEIAEPNGWLGVDLGIVQIASLSDGTNWNGGAVTLRRKKNVALRRQLQTKQTKSAKRLLKKRRRTESRWARDVNHQISKQIVETAERTGTGIALETLTGIRDRVRHRKPQRSPFASWSFAQLGAFITYKAERAGVAVMYVDPAYTSQQCSACGHVSRKNRPDQATFVCTSCGMSLHADHNAARNIAARGEFFWAQSTVPSAA